MGHQLNLIPDDLIEKMAWKKMLFRRGALTLGMVIIFLSAAAFINMQTTSMQQNIRQLQQKYQMIQGMGEKRDALAAEQKRLSATEAHFQKISERQSTSLKFARLGQAVSQDVQITFFKIDPPDRVTLKGQAHSNKALAEFLDHLNRMPLYTGVRLLYSRREVIDGDDFVVFEITKGS
ncbi:MAG: PilN domain-containing protein [Nitrospiria bacterium]